MSEFKDISSKDLKSKIDDGDDFVLIDVLGEDSYKNIHLPGAVLVDGHQSKEDFLSEVENLVDDKSDEVIVYCASPSCQLSPKAAGWLTEAGYENVYDFAGGLKGWAESGYSFEGDKAEEIAENLGNK